MYAAKIAVDAINANDNILKDYALEMVVGSSDSCAAESFSEALTETVKHVTNTSHIKPVGIIGMVCPSTMLHVSPFASLPEISLLQVTAGTTPPGAIARSRARVKIDHIYQTAPASTIHNDALIALMKEQRWKRIAMVRLTSGLNIIHVNQGIDLQEKFGLEENMQFNITFNGEVTTGEDGAGLQRILDEIRNRMARIIYVSLPDREARDLLCASYWRRILSPSYTWVLHDHLIEYLKRDTDNCTEKMMAEVLNGTILLQYNVIHDRNRNLDHTNLKYGEYEKLYRQLLLNESGNDTLCGREPEIIHSNAMFDSVVALALALNKSQTTVNLTRYGRGMPLDTAKINRHMLRDVNFTGAGGQISFNESTHELEVSSFGVSISRINNLNLLPYAYYNSTTNDIKRLMHFSSAISDSFDEDIQQVHIALSAVMLAIISTLVLISTIVLILYAYHCNNPDIKATSPILSVVILMACFLLYLSAIFTAVRSSFVDGTTYAILCILEWWTFVISIQVIFTTLFMRLLRVYRIFFHYQKVGKLWSDGALLVYISLFVSVSVVFLILWTGIDTLTTDNSKTVFHFSTTDPHFDVYLDCHSDYLAVWLGLIMGYSGLTMLAVMALAIMTRKVKIESFRDTKEVNAFVFTTVFLIVLFIPLSQFLPGATDATLYSKFILRELCLLLVPIACKIFVFAPKIYYAHFADPTRHKNSNFHTSGKHTKPRSSFSASGTV